ncbi:hypothetical protein RBSH_05449 [Rhodopirellula baltica SH28]|uniref:Uncharacterized protein n=1 Tax=Rhodopirellula baltica SH28 TaxID=993517 RepID=K5D907_RHOBT|nr:hypothetical protein RBSH_05449 [Rhodopirellula baltica SH28]
MKANWLANGQHQPTRHELNLAVGQNEDALFNSRGDAPGYVEKGPWPLTEKSQLQNSPVVFRTFRTTSIDSRGTQPQTNSPHS